jgi:hypothetical protein
MRLCFDEYMHARLHLVVWVLVQTRVARRCDATASDSPFSFIRAAKRSNVVHVKPSSRALKGVHHSEARMTSKKLLAVRASVAFKVVELVHFKGSELALGRLSSAHRLLAPVAEGDVHEQNALKSAGQ